MSGITTAITQVAANKLKIKTDVKCDLGSSHCYHAVSPLQSVVLRTLIVLHELVACHDCSSQFSPNGCTLSILHPWIICRACLRWRESLAGMSRTERASREHGITFAASAIKLPINRSAVDLLLSKRSDSRTRVHRMVRPLTRAQLVDRLGLRSATLPATKL